MMTFGNRCASCHGVGAQGTSVAPGLLDREYATDFRNAPAFHSAVGRPVPAHMEFIDRQKTGRIRFNDLELMAKFLREARRSVRQNR